MPGDVTLRVRAVAAPATAHSSFTMPLTRRLSLAFASPLLVLFLCCCSCSADDFFSNSFLVRFRRDVGPEEARHVASRNGFVNMGPVSLQLFPARARQQPEHVSRKRENKRTVGIAQNNFSSVRKRRAHNYYFNVSVKK